jgi:hypothetical protein
MASLETTKTGLTDPLSSVERLIFQSLGEDLGLREPVDNSGRAHALSTAHNIEHWRRFVPRTLQRIAERAQQVTTSAGTERSYLTATEWRSFAANHWQQSRLTRVQQLLQDAAQQLYLADSFAAPAKKLVHQVRVLSGRLPGLDLYTDRSEHGLVLTLSSASILIDIIVQTGQVHVRYVNEHGTELDDPYAEKDIRDCLHRGDIDDLTKRLQVLLELERLANEPTLQSPCHPRGVLIQWNDALVSKTASAAAVTLADVARDGLSFAFMRLTDGVSLIYDLDPLTHFVPAWKEATLEQIWHTDAVRKAFFRVEQVLAQQGDGMHTQLRPVLHLTEAMPITSTDWIRLQSLSVEKIPNASKRVRATDATTSGNPSTTLWKLVCSQRRCSIVDLDRETKVDDGSLGAFQREDRYQDVGLECAPKQDTRQHPTRWPRFLLGESAPAFWIQRIPLHDPEQVIQILTALRQRSIMVDLMHSLVSSAVSAAPGADSKVTRMTGLAGSPTAPELSELGFAAPSLSMPGIAPWMSESAQVCWQVHQYDLETNSILVLERLDAPKSSSDVEQECADSRAAPVEGSVASGQSFASWSRIEIVVSPGGRIQAEVNGTEHALLGKMLATSRNIIASLTALEFVQ